MDTRNATCIDPWDACMESDGKNDCRGEAGGRGRTVEAWCDMDRIDEWNDLPGDHSLMWIERSLFEMTAGRLMPRNPSLSPEVAS